MVTRQELDALRDRTMPKGAIIMWSGKIDTIPAGFRLCDGGVAPDYGVVPDLRGRFIVGLAPSKASDPVNAADTPDGIGTAGSLDAGAITTEYRVGEMDALWEAATVKTEGGGELHENRPPYYVLAFIIKVV